MEVFNYAEESDEWGALYLTFPQLNARITTISSEGFEAFENRFVALGDPTGNRTLLPALRRLCPNR